MDGREQQVVTLSWELLEAGVRFSVGSADGPVSNDLWLVRELQDSAGKLVSASPLIRLLQGDEATATPDGLLVSHTAVSALSDAELKLVGLPPRRDPSVAIRSRGSLADDDFGLEVTLAYPGRALGVPVRIGAFIREGEHLYVLSPQTLLLLERVAAFNAAPPGTYDGRLRGWAEIRELASGAELDGYLGELRVVMATRFALRPRVNEAGEADFDVAFVDPVKGDSLLADARTTDFNRTFRKMPSVRQMYAVGHGMQVVCDQRVRAALIAAHKAVRAGPAERRAFLRSPHARMRAELPEDLADLDLGDVFQDADLSDRVKAVGIYEPRVLPWLTRTGHSWLPPEKAGIQIEDRRIELGRADAEQLLNDVHAAVASGAGHVDFRGERIPSTFETASALEHVIRELEAPLHTPASAGEPAADDASHPESEDGRKVLQIHDNLETLQYRAQDSSRQARLPRGIDDVLKTSLLAHQVEALEYLCSHYEAGRPGALLADDMGLGKTLTALAFLGWLKMLQVGGLIPERPFLLVAPTGLLRTWARESETHLAPRALGFRLDAHGPGLGSLRFAPSAKELAVGLPVLDVEQLQRADWVMTTYETLRDYQHSFGRVHWGCVVFDEAQKIKNPSVAMTDAAKAMNATFRLAMTGTPVENRLTDLWSIVDAVHAGRLGALKSFAETYDGESPKVLDALRGLHHDLTAPPPFMIRRTKEGRLKGLPAREFHLEQEPMSGAQAAAYTEVVRQARAPKAQILRALHRLRQVSLHPMDLSAATADEEFISGSARWRVLVRCLDRIQDAGEKALVFLEDLEMQGVAAAIVQRRYALPRAPLIISGEVTGSRRQSRVDEFQARPGFDVMILSPRAAGVGLTITAANHVVHLSRWWNPAVEDQCNDRVYRIGQQKTVHVYLPCAVHPLYGEDSFDVKLHALLDLKRARSRDVLSPPEISDREMGDLFEAVCPTH